MALLNAKGEIGKKNNAFAQLCMELGCQRSNNFFSWLTEHGEPDIAKEVFKNITQPASGRPQTERIEIIIRDDKNQSHPLEISLMPIELSVQTGISFLFKPRPEYCLIIEDNTHKHEETRQLLLAKETAERTTETKSLFLANMSHEIRTPIQTMLGMTELLQETDIDNEQREYLRQLRFSVDVLLSLINDILDLSKIEASKMPLEHIELDLEDIVEQVSDMLCLEAHRKNLELLIDIPPSMPTQIMGDPSRIRQIIVNLAKNAVKFTARGTVIISLRKSQYHHRESIRLSIADTGIGVSDDQRKGLFTSFFQADSSTTRRFGGTGLGLSISKQLVELFGGTIELSDNRPQGSIFSFTIPVDFIGKAPSPLIKGDRLDEHILIVDDHVQGSSILENILKSFGYAHIYTAHSGAQALEILQLNAQKNMPIDNCLVDMLMPEMDGWRLAAEIHSLNIAQRPNLILMVPQGMLGADAKMTLLKWFNAYINKPIKRKELARALNKLPTYKAAPLPDDSEEVLELEELEELEELTPAPLPNTQRPLSSGPAILVVEDHDINRDLLMMILERAGYPTYGATDGLDAIRQIKSKNFDLIFMDIQMPHLNGYQTSKKIRSMGFTMPIIAVSASAQEGERERCLAAGMNENITKPFHRKEILRYIELFLPPPTAKVELLQRPEIFNYEQLKENLLGNLPEVQSLVRRYLEKGTPIVQGLTLLAQNKNWKELAFKAHFIKGSALNMQAQRLAKAAKVLEEVAKKEDALKASANIKELSLAWTEFSKIAGLVLENKA